LLASIAQKYGDFSVAPAGLLNPASGALDVSIHPEQSRKSDNRPTVLLYIQLYAQNCAACHSDMGGPHDFRVHLATNDPK
jgi:hypothetical protein